MSEEVYDDGHLRKYLLGELTEEEQQALEARLLSDDELFDRLLVAEDDLVDDYLGGALSIKERERFDIFFLSTPERRRTLSFAMALRRYVTTEAGVAAEAAAAAEPASRVVPRPSPVIGHPSSPSSWWKQAFSSPYLRMAAAAVIGLGLMLGVWRVFFYQSEVDKGIAALAQAYRYERPVEARISGLAYAPYTRTRGGELGKVDTVSRDRGERILLDEVVEHPGPASHHALGEFYVAEQIFDKAINQFEQAVNADPNNAKFQSDYGAALLEKGKANREVGDARKTLEEFAQSLEHLSKALDLDNSLLEALFNLALCHQYMDLSLQAKEDWRRYLEKDSKSKWADEARENAKQVEQQNKTKSRAGEESLQEFVRSYESQNDEGAWKALSQTHYRTGNSVVVRLVKNYLELSGSGQTADATRALEMLGYVGNLEVQRGGDHFTQDLSRFYSTLVFRNASDIVKAHELLNRAHEHYNQSDFEAAITEYVQAQRIFKRDGDICDALLTEHWIGYCYFQQPNTRRSLLLFTQLAKTSNAKKYVWLLSAAMNGLANIQFRLSEYSKAIELYNRALLLSEQISDESGVLRSFDRLAGALYVIGKYHESLSSVESGLHLARRISATPSQVVPIYATAAADFTGLGLLEAALDYLQQTVRLSLETQNPVIISRYYVQLGLGYAKLKRYETALESIQAGFQIGQKLKSQSIGQEIMAYSYLNLADVHRQQGDHLRAVEYYDQAVAFYSRFDNPEFLFLAHKGMLLSYIAQGDNSSASRELQTVIPILELYRSRILEESNRNTFFDAEQSIYDVAIEFAYSSLGDSEKAFDYSEISKARSLLDLAGTTPQVLLEKRSPDLLLSSKTPPVSLSEIQQRLPSESQILQYAMLENNLLIWVVSKAGASCVEIPVSRQDLNRKTIDYLRSMIRTSESVDDQARQQSKELYDLLIKPIEASLDESKDIGIIPDKVLAYLPFGALISPTSERYFVEDHRFVICPSSSLFLFCSDSAVGRVSASDETLLSVGNPSFDHNAFPTFSELDSAAREARDITQYYFEPQLLTGSEATKSRVLKGIERSDVLHLALHYVTDEGSPMLSNLLLAKGPTTFRDRRELDSVLHAYEIYGLKLRRTRLVVLSACQTGIEGYYKGEGPIGLARPFLAAGVPLVVSTLWSVGSDSTAELMVSFHRNRKIAHLSTTEALRQAQLSLINSPGEHYRKPFYWAGFIVIGGYTHF